MRKCTKCGQDYTNDKNYCLKCGIALDQDLVNQSNIQMCVQCDTVNEQGFNFCKMCGAKLAIIKTTIVSEEDVKSDEFKSAIKHFGVANSLSPKEKSITDEVVSANKIRDAIDVEEISQKSGEKANLMATASRLEKCPPDKSNKKYNLVMYAIIGLVISILIVVGYLAKSYFNKHSDQLGRNVKQKPEELLKPSKPKPSEKLPIVEQPKEQPSAAVVKPPPIPSINENQPKPTKRASSVRKHRKHEVSAKAKQTLVLSLEETKEQKPKKKEKKSFAPHSRDEL
jgi:hypothetical protein